MNAGQKTIIVGEDEQDNAEMCVEMMCVNRFHVLKASGSKPAMSMIKEENPAAFILDIMKPDIPGLKVLWQIDHQPVFSTIPVIVFPTKSLPADIKTGLEAWVSIYLTKPVEYLDLIKAAEKVLDA